MDNARPALRDALSRNCMRRLRWPWLLLVLLCAPLLRAAEPPLFLLPATVDSSELAPYLVYHCPDRALSLADARQLDYQPAPADRIAFGYRHRDCWFRLRLANGSTAPRDLVLTLDFAMLDQVRLFQLTPEGVREQVAGDAEPWEERRLRTRLFSFPFRLEAGASSDFYLQVHTTSSLTLPQAVTDQRRYIEEGLAREMALGAFYGIGIGLVLYNLLLWAAIRERAYAWYVLHLASALLFFACLHGAAYRFWPEWTDWNNRAPYVFAYGAMLFGTLFTRDFLSLPRRWHRLNRFYLFYA
ncbi:MAG: 7TM-DISM domain-containing protein, partial [Moraxellaceae bacterium]